MVHEMNELARLAKIEIDRAEAKVHDANILIEFCRQRMATMIEMIEGMPGIGGMDDLRAFVGNTVQVIDESVEVFRA